MRLSTDIPQMPNLTYQVLSCHFFYENLLQGSLGVNDFAQAPDLYDASVPKKTYVFPPICLIPHVIKYMETLRLSYTIVVPDVCPRRFWWPSLASSCSSRYFLAVAGTFVALLTSSKNGFSSNWSLPWDLWIFRLRWLVVLLFLSPRSDILQYNNNFVI